jgi:hypothetical protein
MERTNLVVYWRPAGFTGLMPVTVITTMAETRQALVDVASGLAKRTSTSHRICVSYDRLVIKSEVSV